MKGIFGRYFFLLQIFRNSIHVKMTYGSSHMTIYGAQGGQKWAGSEQDVNRKAYVVTKFFYGGPRTKMKNSSENFWRASGAYKKGFPNFRLRRPIFRCGGTKNR